MLVWRGLGIVVWKNNFPKSPLVCSHQVPTTGKRPRQLVGIMYRRSLTSNGHETLHHSSCWIHSVAPQVLYVSSSFPTGRRLTQGMQGHHVRDLLHWGRTSCVRSWGCPSLNPPLEPLALPRSQCELDLLLPVCMWRKLPLVFNSSWDLGKALWLKSFPFTPYYNFDLSPPPPNSYLFLKHQQKVLNSLTPSLTLSAHREPLCCPELLLRSNI